MPGTLYLTFFTFLALFPILNPPAMAPVFLQLTGHVQEPERNRLARLIGIYTFALLTSLLFIGGWMLKLLGISIPVISVAGGLLLFHSAWHMLNRDPRMTESEKAEIQVSMKDKAFFPLTLPVTAGPGTMAVTLSLVPAGNLLDPPVLLRYAAVAGGIALAALAVYIFYRFSGAVIRKMGPTGAATVSQISAFVLLAIGVQIVWNGLRELIRTL
ncbi:MarC family protein [Geothrix sp. 21YS21S-2]|uniref:MarC family protein n=1 Tax=Geothrix sp. 21YS21S-2 TaxID=3068893 RepID=UPI0027B9881B|nr:MarC family protein [Geothrix sp. 21YS21S-2]